jgi:hypothetical protein
MQAGQRQHPYQYAPAYDHFLNLDHPEPACQHNVATPENAVLESCRRFATV